LAATGGILEISAREDAIMTGSNGRHRFLFDGDCGVCTYLSSVAERIDGGRRFLIEPYQRVPEEELRRFGVTYEKCAKRAYVLTRGGRAYGGAFAVNHFLFYQFPWTIAILLIYAIPVLLLFEILGYWLVAKNRHRISRWFGMTACLTRS
jgi:predicted DCC family thiol-disulfide oxidoreductase YuxK